MGHLGMADRSSCASVGARRQGWATPCRTKVGPRLGLISHVVYPEGDGFVVAEVWRTAHGQSYVDDVLRPLLAELHLAAGETTVLPVWSFARP
jgi:hypothetical protein